MNTNLHNTQKVANAIMQFALQNPSRPVFIQIGDKLMPLQIVQKELIEHESESYVAIVLKNE